MIKIELPDFRNGSSSQDFRLLRKDSMLIHAKCNLNFPFKFRMNDLESIVINIFGRLPSRLGFVVNKRYFKVIRPLSTSIECIK